MLKFKIVAALTASAILISSFSFAGSSNDYVSGGYACELSQQRVNYEVVTRPAIRVNGSNLEKILEREQTGPYTLTEIEKYAQAINSER